MYRYKLIQWGLIVVFIAIVIGLSFQTRDAQFISTMKAASQVIPAGDLSVIGKPSLTQARLHCRQVAARASDLDAVWCKKARPRSALPIAISKGAWATATRLYIWRRLPSWPQARWPDSFARHKVSPRNPQAPPHGALKKNHGQRRPCKSWKVFPPACAVAFSSSTRII